MSTVPEIEGSAVRIAALLPDGSLGPWIELGPTRTVEFERPDDDEILFDSGGWTVHLEGHVVSDHEHVHYLTDASSVPQIGDDEIAAWNEILDNARRKR